MAETLVNARREALTSELSRLTSIDDAKLHQLWRVRIGRRVPSHLSRRLFLRLLSYRLQAQAFGDLDRSARRRLEAIVAGVGQLRQNRASGGAVGLRPGAVLVREHGGELHRVMVLDGGFAWSGKTYGSLSEAAYAITGTRWNGRRFFGLGRVRSLTEGNGAGT